MLARPPGMRRTGFGGMGNTSLLSFDPCDRNAEKALVKARHEGDAGKIPPEMEHISDITFLLSKKSAHYCIEPHTRDQTIQHRTTERRHCGRRPCAKHPVG